MSKFKFDTGSQVIRRTAQSEAEAGIVTLVMANRAYRQVKWDASGKTSPVQAAALMYLEDYISGKREQTAKKNYWLEA